MSSLSTLLLVLVAAIPTVEIETLSGDQHTGQLEKLNVDTVTLNSKGKTLTLPVKDILLLAVKPTEPDKKPAVQTRQIVLRDGTTFLCTDVTTANKELKLKSTLLGELTLPLSAVRSIRLVVATDKIEQSWQELATRTLKRDYLVIQKGDVLDHLDGAIGALNEQTVQFLLDDNTISVKRDKVFGLIYARSTQKTAEPLCTIRLTNGDSLRLHSIQLENNSLRAKLFTGTEIIVPVVQTALLDFSLGKVMYLSQTKPRAAKFTSFLGYEYSYRNNQNDAGQLLKLDKTYARGLWIHSKTELQYRLGKQYRKFQAVMGIDRNLANYTQGYVHVVIKGDNRLLFKQDVKGSDKPLTLNLSVEGVRDLNILVDFGPNSDFCDHLDLADAKVIK